LPFGGASNLRQTADASGIEFLRSLDYGHYVSGPDNLGDNHPTTHRPWGVGRDVGRGPGYFTFDVRLARRFPFGADSRRNLELTGEAFNLLNRTNFLSVNNVVGSLTLAELPNPIVGHAGNPTDPLAFTSAFEPRQLQFGLKVKF
jgi:hypothetical protein